MFESPKFVDIEMMKVPESMTLDQDRRSQTSVETRGKLMQRMVGLIESGYRPVNKDGFLTTQDRAAVSGLIHLVRDSKEETAEVRGT